MPSEEPGREKGDERVLALILEDDLIIALGEARVLEELGYSTLRARSASQALALVERRGAEIGVVLADVDLGEGPDGIAAAASIRKLSGAPIVFLTSRSEAEVEERARGLEGWAYAPKSLDPPRLDAAIKAALGWRI